MTPHVILWPHEKVSGWNGHGEPLASYPCMELKDALDAEHLTDAHFSPTLVEDKDGVLLEMVPRLNKGSIKALEDMGCRVVFEVATLDADDPTAHAAENARGLTKNPSLPVTAASPEWRVAEFHKLQKLDLSGVTFYETRGGYRLIYTLSRRLDIPEYVAFLASLRAEAGKVGIKCDELKDWNRCYRAPRTIREDKILGKILQSHPAFYRGEIAHAAEGGVRVVPEHIPLLAQSISPQDRQKPVLRGASPQKPMAGGVTRENAARHIAQAPMPLREEDPIKKNRNNTLTALAGRWREYGATDEELQERLPWHNETYCEPPLDRDEVDRIVNSICGYEAGVPNVYDHPDLEKLTLLRLAKLAPKKQSPAPVAPPRKAEDENVGEPSPQDNDVENGQEPEDAAPEAESMSKEPFTLDSLLANRRLMGIPPPEGGDDDEGGGGSSPIPNAGLYTFTYGSEAEVAKACLPLLEGENGGMPLVFDRGSFRQYNPEIGIWEPLKKGLIHLVVTQFEGALVGGGEKAKPLKVQLSLAKNVREFLEYATDKENFFDHAPKGLAFGNGFLALSEDEKSVDLLPHSHEHRATFRLPEDYIPGAAPREFLKFLKGVWRDDLDRDDKIEYVRQFMGVCLLGLATKFQKCVVLTGGGENGKSVLAEIFGELFKGEGYDPGAYTSIPPQEMDNEYRKAQLANARINIVSELPEHDILESGPVKAIITGDSINARVIRETPFSYRPTAGHVFSANTLPNARDLTDGFWRRFDILTFNRSFKKDPEREKDPAKRILKTERAAIASWAIEGAITALQNEHYPRLASSEAALKEWRDSADQVSSFLATKCWLPTDPGVPEGILFGVAAKKLYEVFSVWAKENGHASMSSTALGKRLNSLKIEVKEVTAGNLRMVAFKGDKAIHLRLVPTSSDTSTH